MSAAVPGRDRRGDGLFVRILDGKILLACSAGFYPREIPIELNAINTPADVLPVLLDLSRRDWFTRRHLTAFLKALTAAKGWAA